MVKLFRILSAVCMLLLFVSFGFSATYYVDTKGSDSATGAMDQPFATLQKGNDKAVAGDTIFIRGGTYAMKTGISITKSGSSDTKRIYFLAYHNETPIFDFTDMSASSSAGMLVSGCNWLHIKGLELCNVPQPSGATPNCVLCTNSGNIIFEQCNFHHNSGTGLFIAYGTGGHLVLNCDSHHNYDPKSSQGDGQNADGFGVHYQKSGPSTTIRGCRSWWNSDDGFDCINQGVAVVVENCWNALSGYKPGTMTSAPDGNGNGFKLGGWALPPKGYPTPVPVHTLRKCVSFFNKAAGFYHNHHPANNFFYNNTAYKNGVNFNMLGYDLATSNDKIGMGTWRNNVAFMGTATSNANGADAANNSWNISGLTVTASDFESIDTAGVFGPRKPDGSLPDVKFMRLSATSKLIDKGTDVGLPFSGAAPDLGAFEFGATSALRLQPPFRCVMPVVSSGDKNGAQKNMLFDTRGRKLDSGPADRVFRPLVCKAIGFDGGKRVYLVIRLR
jgi:hypothetical protein